ncbi:MAG: M3 family oligoendopeptidase [Chloroflexi bacterium]|nr:M3 family oligoendopeptidase [Chloroflexota bacterium]
MWDSLPKTVDTALEWDWAHYEPFFSELKSRAISDISVGEWLLQWSEVARIISEVYSRLSVATTVDTNDAQAESRYNTFMESVYPRYATAANDLNEKLVRSELEPAGFDVPLRNLRSDLKIFREANLPLQTEESKLSLEYSKIIGAQTVEWEGKEVTLTQLAPVQQDPNRATRERAWKLTMERRLADRAPLNELWGKFLDLRDEQARNAGLPSYTEYRYQQLHRFDYSPVQAQMFRDAIETVVVPAAKRIYERQSTSLGLESIRPWDTDVDALNRPPLKPFAEIEELNAKTQAIFDNVDSTLGDYFRIMHDEGLLDLENRKGKAPGGYCTYYAVAKRPFIFMNSVGLHDDVQTMLHEGGHAFHAFEGSKLPYFHQEDVPMEFAEVASMGMELLAAPYLSSDRGGFYSAADAARARIEHLESIIKFWPYMAVVDAFQHWVYANLADAHDPVKCDAKWSELWDRFMVGIDYSGMEDIKSTGWHRKLHIYQVPFYYIEYGLAQLGAVQIFGNARKDQAQAVWHYRKALALGGTVTLPDLFGAAGVRFAFDVETLGSAVALVEQTIEELAAV